MTTQGIGAAVKRKEDRRFLLGKGNYVDDMTLPNQTYAVFVRSMYEMNTAAQQRRTTECHGFQATRTARAGTAVTPAGDPAGAVRSDMDDACWARVGQPGATG